MATNIASAQLKLHKRGAVAELVLNRPAARNAISMAMWRILPGLLGEIANDDAVRILMIHGGKSGVFSAGADIHELGAMKNNRAAAQQFYHQMGAAIETLAAFPKPVIARIEGPCIGAGLALALACDIRIADASARFGVTPAKLGITFPLADTRRLVAAIGSARAKDLMFSSRLIDAGEAQDFGLIEYRLETAQSIDFAADYAAQLSQRSPRTQSAMKTTINALSADDMALHAQSCDIFTQSFCAADFEEGFAAFTEKRKPDF